MKAGIAILVVLLILAFVLGSAYVGRRNEMAIKREAVNAAWAQVDVVLQRRADLIPNLVETVKGYASQEQKVFGDIAAARAALVGAKAPADKIAANGQLDSALSRLLVIVENYPQLKSNENFMRLQDERKTVSRWNGAGTMKRCRTTTRIFRCSRIVWWQVLGDSRATTRTSRPRRERGKLPR